MRELRRSDVALGPSVRNPIASVQIADARLNRGSAALVDRRRYTHSVPVISVFLGIVIRMFYQEHVPPHFHAEHQGHQASFDFTGKVLAGCARHAIVITYSTAS
jgi:hypothetical protein